MERPQASASLGSEMPDEQTELALMKFCYDPTGKYQHHSYWMDEHQHCSSRIQLVVSTKNINLIIIIMMLFFTIALIMYYVFFTITLIMGNIS